jgi:hypothetical protein
LASASTPRRPITSGPTVDGDAAATLFIDEQKVGLQFGGYNDGFRFTWIELLPERRNLVLVLGCDDTNPRPVKLDCVPGEFALDRWRNYDLRIQITQQVELVDGGEVEDWGSVGNNDQAPGSLFTR